MSDAWSSVFSQVSEIILEMTGNVLTDNHSEMVTNRLSKRFNTLGISSADEYLDYLQKNKAKETQALISLLTTHHTFFMREFAHLKYVSDHIAEVAKRVSDSGRKEIRIWSAACSYGHEAYSIAMVVKPALAKIDPSMTFKILGSDIDPEAVKKAQNGVYRFSDLKSVPADYIDKNWQRGTGDIVEFVRATKNIKDHCTFKVGNLTAPTEPIFKEKFDIIFCRNVFIYFDHATVKSVALRMIDALYDEGLLISGMTESLTHFQMSIDNLGSSIYQKPAANADRPVEAKASTPTMAPAKQENLRVLCVDDSPLVLKLLKKVLDYEGFEVVGTACDGEDAAKKVKELKPDVMTLDVHMPVLDGLEYLRKYHNEGHPPVVVVSSVSYEDGDVVPNLYKAGAFDFVEKPDLKNLAKVGDELRNKLELGMSKKGVRQKGVVADKRSSAVSQLDLTKDSSVSYEKCLQLVYGPAGADLPKAVNKFSPWDHLIVVKGASANLTEVGGAMMGAGFAQVSAVKTLSDSADTKVRIVSETCLPNLVSLKERYEKVVVTVVGPAPKGLVDVAKNLKWHLVMEDKFSSEAVGVTSDVVPVTSFHYHVKKAFLNWSRKFTYGNVA